MGRIWEGDKRTRRTFPLTSTNSHPFLPGPLVLGRGPITVWQPGKRPLKPKLTLWSGIKDPGARSATAAPPQDKHTLTKKDTHAHIHTNVQSVETVDWSPSVFTLCNWNMRNQFLERLYWHTLNICLINIIYLFKVVLTWSPHSIRDF